MIFRIKENKENKDLKRLQELTSELRKYKEQLKNFNDPPLYDNYYNDNKYYHNSNIQISELGNCFAVLFSGYADTEGVIDTLKMFLPDKNINYLKDWGEYLIKISNWLEEIEKLKSKIFNLEKEIKELKEKLKIN